MATLAGGTVPIPEPMRRRLNIYKGIAALLLVALWGWFGFIKNAEVRILEYLDIAVHEIGHRVFSPFGETTMLIMGSGSECLFPFVVGLVFGIWKRDLIAWGICWAWCASSCADAARYIADATQGQLALLGAGPDTMGDWERILGPEHWDKLFLADNYARNVHTVGLVIWWCALGLVVGGIAWNWKKIREVERPTAVEPTTRPVTPLAPVGPEEMWR